jgi:ribose/xylose/arabinose/galactoside ABC-type transport system permease subunit
MGVELIIAAVVIGGASLNGGKGNAVNTLMGVLILGLIGNILNLLNVPSYPQQVVSEHHLPYYFKKSKAKNSNHDTL